MGEGEGRRAVCVCVCACVCVCVCVCERERERERVNRSSALDIKDASCSPFDPVGIKRVCRHKQELVIKFQSPV